MLNVLFFGLPTMVACLLLQSVLLVVATRYYYRREWLVERDSFWTSMIVVIGVMLLLLLGNLAQIGIWALLFMFLGEFDQFKEAFYHAAVNFSTLGYGDIVMSPEHRVLGPLEAVNGVLMIGVSTAVLMAALQDVMKKAIASRRAQSG